MEKTLLPSLRSLPASPARRGGFTLIEVMVALIVLVLGVLGASAMTLTALRDNKQSALRSQAAALAYELGDLIRSNRPGSSIDPADPLLIPDSTIEAIFTGSQPTGAIQNCWTSGCTLTENATNDFYEWLRKLTDTTTGLPNASAKVCHDRTQLASTSLACDNDATAPLVVKIRWDEKQNRGSSQAATTQVLAIAIQPLMN